MTEIHTNAQINMEYFFFVRKNSINKYVKMCYLNKKIFGIKNSQWSYNTVDERKRDVCCDNEILKHK